MRKLLLKIAYDGTDFCGWQIQPNGITVQAVLTDALCELLSEKVCLHGCSRTDSGVHANEFFCHFTTENTRIDTKGFVGALNVRLPSSVAVLDCIEVDGDFHARYSALGKQYVYKMYASRVRNPFLDKYALRLPKPLNVSAVNEFCVSLVGTHDFAAFSATGREYATTVRTISECRLLKDNENYSLFVSGDGFLYNMVRIITGTVLYVSEGKISPADAPKILSSCERSLAGPTAPPHGLYLNKVFYNDYKSEVF